MLKLRTHAYNNPSKFILFNILLITSMAAVFTACSKNEPTKQDKNSLTVRVVHDPSVTDLISRLTTAFNQTSPKLNTGQAITIELDAIADLQASKSISNGSLKTEAWLAPSNSLVEHTNSNLTNLGPAQGKCLTLFSTPIVLATLQKNLAFFGAENGSFSWNDFFNEKIAATGAAPVSLAHSSPSSSPSGLASLIQLAYLANTAGDKSLSIDELKSKRTWSLLSLFESKVSNYGASDNYLLERASSSIASRVRFALTSEKALASYNQTLDSGKQKLAALYPNEGSIWLDYQLCSSQADWVTAAHQAAIKQFADFLSSEKAQGAMRVDGYRTSIVKFEQVAPLTKSNGVNLELPKASFESAPAPVVSHLISAWPDLAKPSAFVAVVDTSGSMEGDRLYLAKDAFRRLVAGSGPRDLISVVRLGSEPKTEIELSSDKKTLVKTIDSLSSAGGSAIYDSLREGILSLGAERVKDYRKTIILITDGDDKNSVTPIERFLDFTNERCATLDLNLVIIGIKDSSVDYSILQRIAKTARGSFIEAESSELPGVVAGLLNKL